MRGLAIALASAALACAALACAEPTTTIRATITWSDVEIDQLALALLDGDTALFAEAALVPQSARPLASGETVDVIVAPEHADRRLAFLTDGRAEQRIEASGDAEVVAAAGTRTDIEVKLGPSLCGDGELRPVIEGCDDGNNDDHDGCGPTCLVEPSPCVDDDPVSADTPNHLPDDAAQVPLPYEAGALVVCPGGPDYYRVTVDTGRLDVYASSSRGYPLVSLADTSGTPLASSDDGEVTFDSTPQSIVIRVEAEADYRHPYSLSVAFTSQ